MSRKLKIIFVAGIAALLLVLSAGWYGLSHYYLINTTLPAPLTTGMDYRDPDTYFTIEIPTGWHITRDVSEYTPSFGQEQYHLTTITTALILNDPPGADDPFVSINLIVVRDAGSKHWVCTAIPIHPNTTIAGLPAQYAETYVGNVWMVNSQDAQFQISYRIGKSQSGHGSVEPTPRPVAEVTSRTALLTSIIATFRPTPDQPLSC